MRSFLLALLCCVLSLPAMAQTFGEITGLVRDQSGAALVDAQVTVVNADTNATRTTPSNEAGAFSFPALPPGTYRVEWGMTSTDTHHTDGDFSFKVAR